MGALATLLTNWTQPQRRSGTSHPDQWLVDWVRGGAATSSGVSVNASSALKYTPFWAAVRIISGTLASLPFKVYRRLGNGGKQPQADHGTYQLLHERPNDYMDAVTFIETRQAHVLCYGNGYAEIQRDGRGRPVALWPLLPDRTQRAIGPDGTPYYEIRTQVGETFTLPDYNVLHIKGLGFDGYTGYDVVAYHKEAIGYGVAVKEYAARFYGQDANPGGVLEHPSTLSDDSFRRLKESWAEQHEGLSHAHRMQILEEGMKWHPVSVDPDKAQAVEAQKFTVDDCARIFQIPPHKLASMEFSKYNNVEQLQIDFVCTTMLYWFRKWEQEVNYKLFMPSERGQLFAEILADAALRGNTEARTQYYTAGRQWGFLSINDIRAKENMNPIGPAGDVYLDPLNMTPAGSLPSAPEPKPEPAPDDEPDDVVRAAHQVLLAGQWRRIITKLVNANGQRLDPGWWRHQRSWALELLLDGAVAYGSIVGVEAAKIRAALEESVCRHVNSEQTLQMEKAELLAAELMNGIRKL